MKFGEIPVGEAAGAILAHSLRFGATAFKKGRVLSASDVEALCEGPYLELFARARRPGWDGWGNQSDGFANGEFPARRWRANLYPGAVDAAG